MGAIKPLIAMLELEQDATEPEQVNGKKAAVSALYHLCRQVPGNAKKTLSKGIGYPIESVIQLPDQSSEISQLQVLAVELIGGFREHKSIRTLQHTNVYENILNILDK